MTAKIDPFWTARPVLTHIHTYAQARRTSPQAVLGVVLARVVAATTPFVVLPPLVGGFGSLNIFVGLVGPSGAGKGGASAAAAEAINIKDAADMMNVGSGEGISHLFKKRGKEGEEWLRRAVLMQIQEIDTLTSLGTRNSSTILPELRKAWSGETLGMSYADPAKRLAVTSHEYRLTLVAGIQPGRAGALLDDSDGGTPQRFTWLDAYDPTAPDSAPEAPQPWDWFPPIEKFYDQRTVMPVCETARGQIDTQRLIRLRGGGDAMDGHELLARLKIAAALALLDGRGDVEEGDWQLAEDLGNLSNSNRKKVQEDLIASAVQSADAKAVSGAMRELLSEDVKRQAKVDRLIRRIPAYLPEDGSWIHGKDISQRLASRDRDELGEALMGLLRGGMAGWTHVGLETYDKDYGDPVRGRKYRRHRN